MQLKQDRLKLEESIKRGSSVISGEGSFRVWKKNNFWMYMQHKKKCLGPNGAVWLFFRHILKGAESDVNLADGSGR